MEGLSLIKINKTYGNTIWWRTCTICIEKLYLLVLFRHVEMSAAQEEEHEEHGPEQGGGGQAREDGDARPEGCGDRRAVEQGWSGGFGPSSGGEEQGRGGGAGDQPPGVVAWWHAVVEAALWPHPEAQRGGAGVEDGVHPEE